jgi:hypothetical protein
MSRRGGASRSQGGLQTYRILISVVVHFGLGSVLLSDGSILESVTSSSIIIMGGGGCGLAWLRMHLDDGICICNKETNCRAL